MVSERPMQGIRVGAGRGSGRLASRWFPAFARVQVRFIAAIMLLILLLSFSFALVASLRTAGALHRQLQERGWLIVAQLAKDALNYSALENPLERDIRLMVLTNRAMLHEARYVQIVMGGRLVSEAAAEGWAPPVLGGPVERSWMEEIHRRGEPALDFTSPLPGSSGAQPSYVRLGLSLARVETQVRAILWQMAGIAAIFAAGGFGLAVWLCRSILGPLDRLMAPVRRLAAGDLAARAHVQTGDEIEELAQEFNRMAASIAARDAALQRANGELVRAGQAKSEFLARMGHEWKTPLHALRGYAQLLLEQVDGSLNSAQRADVEAMLAAGNHLLDLIDNLLHYIKAEHAEEPNHLERLDLAGLAREAWEHVRPAALAKGLALDDELPPELPVLGDRTRLKQTLINLLSNAVKYTEAGSVTLRGGAGAAETWLSVADTGPGIPEGLQEDVFLPFRRGAEFRRSADGLGLGLAVVRFYVAAHGGSVTLDSAPGRGSVFTVRLPRRPAGGAPGHTRGGAADARASG